VGVQGAIFLGIVGVALFVEGAAYLPCLIDRAVHLVIGLPGAENGNIIVQPLAGDQPPQRIVAVEVGGAATGSFDPVASNPMWSNQVNAGDANRCIVLVDAVEQAGCPIVCSKRNAVLVLCFFKKVTMIAIIPVQTCICLIIYIGCTIIPLEMYLSQSIVLREKTGYPCLLA
jgi:hypothetical protein